MFLRVSHTRVCGVCLSSHHMLVSTIQYPTQKSFPEEASYLSSYLLGSFSRFPFYPFFTFFWFPPPKSFLNTQNCVFSNTHSLTTVSVCFVGFLFLSTLNITAAAAASVSIFRYFSNLWLVLFLCCDYCGVFWLLMSLLKWKYETPSSSECVFTLIVIPFVSFILVRGFLLKGLVREREKRKRILLCILKSQVSCFLLKDSFWSYEGFLFWWGREFCNFNWLSKFKNEPCNFGCKSWWGWGKKGKVLIFLGAAK